jgi:polyhydroxyalkanoate synthesis regulator phasin
MSDRAQKLMEDVWQERNTWADTEQKLVAAVIRKTIEHVKTMTAAKLNNLTVIDKSDMMALSKEVENLKNEPSSVPE